MASHAANYRGILAMIGACGCFSANDAATKIAAAYIPVSQVVATRAVFALLFAILIILWRSEAWALTRIGNPYLQLRAFIEAFTGVLIIFALSRMPIANLTAILLIQPFVMAVIGATWLGEQVGWRRWTAVAAGFIGMLLVMKPGTDGFNAVSLLVLLGACLALSRDLLVRKIPGEIPTTVISFATAMLAVPVGLLGMTVEQWVTPSLYAVAAVAIAAAFLIAAFILTVIAFRGTDVSAVAPFRYSIVVFALVFGVALFGEVPDTLSFLGIGIIVSAGVYMLHREAARRRLSAGKPAT